MVRKEEAFKVFASKGNAKAFHTLKHPSIRQHVILDAGLQIEAEGSNFRLIV